MNFALRSHFRLAHTEYGAVLLNTRTGDYLGVNGVGAEIIKLIETGLTQEEIAEQLAGLYDADAQEIADDARELIDELIKEGAVDVV
ncbi:MAG: PqqD family protein [Microbacteriaceae bacterium]